MSQKIAKIFWGTTGILTSLLLVLFITTLPIQASQKFIAVENDAQAQIVLKESMNMLNSKLGMTFKYPIELKLVTGKELDEIVKASPYKGSVVGIHTFRNGRHMVYMMNNVGRDNFFGTVCHELTHGWQRENNLVQDITLTEGLAVWVEYKCLTWSGAYSLAQRLNDNIADPVYGVGYRFLQKLEDKFGEKNVLSQIKLLKSIPENMK